jgi:hypothetical protein
VSEDLIKELRDFVSLVCRIDKASSVERKRGKAVAAEKN